MHETPTLVSLDDIRLAAGRIRTLVRRTPLLEVTPPGRGGTSDPPVVEMRMLPARRSLQDPRRVQHDRAAVAGGEVSGRHHLLVRQSRPAVALVAEAFHAPAVIVMPETTPRVKVDGVRRHGAEVVFAGTTSTDRKLCAEELARTRGLTIVPPFDHPWIIAGQGTTGLEILEQHSQVRSIYVPVGGGGQIAGVSAAVKRMRPSVRVVGVEPAGAARMTASIAAGRPVTLDRTASIADGLLTLRPGDITFAHVQAFVDDVVTVTDEEIAGCGEVAVSRRQDRRGTERRCGRRGCTSGARAGHGCGSIRWQRRPGCLCRLHPENREPRA